MIVLHILFNILFLSLGVFFIIEGKVDMHRKWLMPKWAAILEFVTGIWACFWSFAIWFIA